MAGNPQGSKWRATPDKLRSTHMLTARLRQATLDAIAEEAEHFGEGKGIVTDAMIAFAKRHRDGIREELQRLREASKEK